jgi:hypothetical protein
MGHLSDRSTLRRPCRRVFERSRLEAHCWAQAYECTLPLVRRTVPAGRAADRDPTRLGGATTTTFHRAVGGNYS